MTDPEELERQAKAAGERMQDPDPWTKEQQDQHRFDNFMEDTMSLLLAAAVSGLAQVASPRSSPSSSFSGQDSAMMRRLTKSKKGQTMQRQPHALLDTLMMIYGIQTDNSLADKLAISTGSVSRIRNGTQTISAALILAIYERSGMSIDNIKDLIKEDTERRLRREKERQEASHAQ